jgi:dihydroorotate dehydrogenase (NAD+) catalytic subunit
MFGQDLDLASPWINAPGTLGFAPPPRWPLPETPGAFITNPISLAPRSPAAGRALLPYPGGYLLHTGHPNPGLNRVLKRYGERWAQSSLPIWVHLLASNPGEVQQMVHRLEGVEGVMALEIGLPPGIRGSEAREFVQAAYGELPLVISMELNMAEEAWIADLPKWGAGTVCLSAPRGILPDDSGRPVSGRLFGPSLLPMALAAVHTARKHGLQVIAGSGVYRTQDAQLLREAGAFAVQLDAVLWRGWAS